LYFSAKRYASRTLNERKERMECLLMPVVVA